MPGEHLDDALAAACDLREKGIATVLTYLGENVSDTSEAKQVADHYCEVLDRISEKKLDCHISVKLTQLGLDLDSDECSQHLRSIVNHASGTKNFVWVDMEGSKYTDSTIDIYKRARSEFPNVGLCLQSYLHRTANDLTSLIPLSPSIRLVKGAYAEPRAVAYQKKKLVDENFLSLATRLLKAAKANGALSAIASHDIGLIRHIQEGASDISPSTCEFQMLYGIKPQEQLRLVRDGYRVRVLVSYGTYWFPWYMRRLAERPANVLFVLRNIFAR